MRFGLTTFFSNKKATSSHDNDSLAQKENYEINTGEKEIYEGMPELIRKVGAEGIVLLKNDSCVLPYDSKTKLAIFGRCQIDYFYVGYGSGGDVRTPYTVNVIDALKNCKSNINQELLDFYVDWIEKNPVSHGEWGNWPTCYDEPLIPDELITSVSKKSSHALIIIGRAAGEDRENKLEKGSFYLTDEETNLLDKVTNAFENVTVVLNCGNIIDMSWVKKYDKKIKAIVYAWQGGMESGNSLCDILYGKVNPSGRLTDTIAINYEDYPSSKNFGNPEYNNYYEDIFVGYRYFETFKKESVLYPFGYGLSYTTFSIEPVSFVINDLIVNVEVNVTNTGKRSGSEVVQLYFKSPESNISKPVIQLIAFDKTKVLEPGEKTTISFQFSLNDVATFDDIGVSEYSFSYILEKGKYTFCVGNNIRDIIDIGVYNNDTITCVKRFESVCGIKEPFERLTYKYAKMGKETVPANIPCLKQRILENLPEEVKIKNKKKFFTKYSFEQVMIGTVPMNDFIKCLSDNELEALSRGCGHMDSDLGVKGNAGAFGGVIPSLRKKGIIPITTTDGPAGLRILRQCSLLPCGTQIACSWDVKLVEELARQFGKEIKEKDSNVILAPGMNIHRNPLCGRNFEYFSEDPLLTGKIAAAFVNGIQANGIAACPKHFACNNQETNRNKNDSRVSQKALREIYLKGFEICVKEAKPWTIMTSYNKINGVWSHYNYDLATTILREEWGYKGCVITDWWMQYAKSPEFPMLRDNAYRVRAQVDVLMPGGREWAEKKYVSDKSLLESLGQEDGITRGELERTAKNVLYLVKKIMCNKI